MNVYLNTVQILTIVNLKLNAKIPFNIREMKVTKYKRNWGLVSLYKSEQNRRGKVQFQFEAAQAQYDGDWNSENRKV